MISSFLKFLLETLEICYLVYATFQLFNSTNKLTLKVSDRRTKGEARVKKNRESLFIVPKQSDL